MGGVIQFDRRSIVGVLAIGFVAAGLRLFADLAPTWAAPAEPAAYDAVRVHHTAPAPRVSAYTCAKIGAGCSFAEGGYPWAR